jgi:hypothetical protein
MTPFLFTISWDHALHGDATRFPRQHTPLNAAWSAGLDRYGQQANDWSPRVPPQGSVTVALVPEAFGITDSRAAALALVACLGARHNGIDRLSARLVQVGGVAEALLDAARAGVDALSCLVGSPSQGASNTGMQRTPPATAWFGHTEGVDGALAQQGGRLFGTGTLDGLWDLQGFFAPLARSFAPSPNASGRHLRDVLDIGGVALALGVVRAWTEQRAFCDVGLDGCPVAFAKPHLDALVGAVLAKHRFDGPGVVRSTARVELLEGRKAHTMARTYQHRTRVASAKGRQELAGDLVSTLLDGLVSTQTLVVDQMPCPTHWRLHPRLLDILHFPERGKMGGDVAQAFQDGHAIGHDVSHQEGTTALLLAARARGWV